MCTRPRYCQLVREANKLKRKKWCQEQIKNKERFDDVIFTDECSVQLDHHGRLCFRKEKQPRALNNGQSILQRFTCEVEFQPEGLQDLSCSKEQ